MYVYECIAMYTTVERFLSYCMVMKAYLFFHSTYINYVSTNILCIYGETIVY